MSRSRRHVATSLLVLIGSLLLICLCSATAEESYLHDNRDDYGHYTNDYVMEIDGDHIVADLVAGTHNLRLVDHIESLGNIYHFIHDDTPSRSKRNAESFLEKLRSDPNVLYVDQQQIVERVKRPALTREQREMIYDKQMELDSPLSNSEAIMEYYFGKGSKRGMQHCSVEQNEKRGLHGFNDPAFCLQWYLRNTGEVQGKQGNDVGVVDVWKKYNIYGEGVVVTVLDDGMDHTHPDLKDNWDKRASADFNDPTDRENDPMPSKKGNNAHGTRCAGEIAAAANNGVCGVGVAYKASIGGIRMLDGKVTDVLEAKALSHEMDYVDIYSASWGPRDDGMTMERPSKLAKKALRDGALKGRGGLGSIFSWATGNGGEDDDCNCDGYVSDIHTISIGCINDMAMSTYFSERCTSTMAVIYTGGSHSKPGTDGYDHPSLSIITTDVDNGCNMDFEGTSSAAPLAAGVFALVLEANPSLTWRDMQNVIVETAQVPNKDEPDWTINAAGYHVNPRFGFGHLHACKMVEKVMNNSWQHVAKQHVCHVPSSNEQIYLKKGGTISQLLMTDGCQSDPESAVERLEHSIIHVDIKSACRGCLSVKIKSSGGTVSEILSERKKDKFSEQFDWDFLTVHNWGENPKGEWELSITDNGNYAGEDAGVLISWSMTLYGVVGPNPNADTTTSSRKVNHKSHSQAYEANTNEIEDIMKDEQAEIKEMDKSAAEITKDSQLSPFLKDNSAEHVRKLDDLARVTLDDNDYKIIHEYLFKDMQETNKADVAKNIWKKMYSRQLQDEEQTEYLENDRSRLQRKQHRDDTNVNRNAFRKVNDDFAKYNNWNSLNDDSYVIENREQKTADDIEDTISLIENIIEKMKEKKYLNY